MKRFLVKKQITIDIVYISLNDISGIIINNYENNVLFVKYI